MSEKRRLRDSVPNDPTRSRRLSASSLRRAMTVSGATLLVAAAVGCGGSDQAARTEAIADLRGWVEQVRHKSAVLRLSDASVEAEAARLRELAPLAEAELAELSPGDAAKGLVPFEQDLSRHLAGFGRPLTRMQAFFLYTDIQHHLERLSEAARLERLLTGPPTVARGHVPTVRAQQDAYAGPNPADTLGIPARYRARLQFQRGGGTQAHNPCFFVTEHLPDFHTVATAKNFADSRGCTFR
jgi:hypothetical protein